MRVEENMGLINLAKRSSIFFVIVLMLLLIPAEIVNANGITIIPPKETTSALLAAVFGIFIFDYLINLGSAALVFKAFGFNTDISSINKLAVTMFKVTIAGIFLMILIHGYFGSTTYGLSQYAVSAVIVSVAEIFLLSFLLHGLYGLRYRKAVSVGVCAITFGVFIGIPFVIMII
jgi:hypothetical protein